MSEFKKIPLPHVLFNRGGLLRVVTTENYDQGSHIVEHSHISYDARSGVLTPMKNVWMIKKLIQKRLAKGDWSAWPEHPTFYECEVTWCGTMPEDQAKKNLPNIVMLHD